MADRTQQETGIPLVEYPPSTPCHAHLTRIGDQTSCKIKLQMVFIVVLLAVIGVCFFIIADLTKDLTGIKKSSSLKPRQTEPPTASSRLQTEKRTSTKPITATTTKFPEVTKRKIVYGHLVPHKGQRKGKAMQWDLTPPSFLSPNGVRLAGNQSIIRFGVSGVYRFSISSSVYSGESHSQAFNNRIRLKIFVNNAPKPIREIESIATGTLSDSFLWKIRFRDSIRLQISDEYWSLHHTKTSFDFNLIADLE